MFTRREFIRGGVSAFTFSFAAPAFLSDLARAQGSARRNLVVLYLSGGNDALSMVIPYTDAEYYARRPVLAIPAANVLQIGSDRAGNALGLNPRLTGLRRIFNTGKLALIQRTGYENSSRSHFQGTDIWSTANVANTQGPGWLGRYLDTIPSPVDALVGWSTTRDVPHLLQANRVGVAAIPSVAFVNSTAQQAFATLDRVSAVGMYRPTVAYPNNGLGQALQAVAGAMVNGIGTRVFFVQTGGYDTHAGQNTNMAGGAYAGLMATLNDGLFAFYNDLTRQGLFGDTLVLQFSEFGRRINENASAGTDHGAASVMMALGGGVRGGIFGTAPNLRVASDNPTLENGSQDVRYETDFRAIYAKVIDSWLGGDSVQVLGADFRGSAPAII